MLAPKSVLITGANRGIGLEFVKAFLNLGSPPKLLFAGCTNPESAKVYPFTFAGILLPGEIYFGYYYYLNIKQSFRPLCQV